MFQNFDDPPKCADQNARLASLRAVLAEAGLAGFIVPKTDEFQNEYVPAHADRLYWLTGFSGSAGTAIALDAHAALLVDSRYTLQAKEQVDPGTFSIENYPDMTVETYLSAHAAKGTRIGYDPRLYSIESARKLAKAAAEAGFEIVPIAFNPIDQLWVDRPPVRSGTVFVHDVRFAGEDASAKLTRIRAKLRDKACDAALIASPESVCWLLNLRGSDIEHTPLVMARLFLNTDSDAVLFIDEHKLPQDVKLGLEQNTEVVPIAAMEDWLAKKVAPQAKVLIDPARTPQSLGTRLSEAGAELIEAPDPCILAKAIKNETELEGARTAHRRDGIALCRFLAWLDREADSGRIDEIGAATKLEEYRRDTNALKDISFDTISGAGEHGAIVHYRVTRSTNRLLSPGSLYLVDSGGQYVEGTTDVTRTVAVGAPTPAMRRHFTLVLKAHIALATARFPKGTRGVDLDPIARNPLWRAGLDYGHGTGHGVGSFLSVHEGPQSISRNGMAALEPGMILSIEPGLYREGEYGIRIENLGVVTPAEPIAGGSIAMMGFETLTLAPIDRNLIDRDLLTREEKDWLDAYHARVRSEIEPHLDAADREWLRHATAAL